MGLDESMKYCVMIHIYAYILGGKSSTNGSRLQHLPFHRSGLMAINWIHSGRASEFSGDLFLDHLPKLTYCTWAFKSTGNKPRNYWAPVKASKGFSRLLNVLKGLKKSLPFSLWLTRTASAGFRKELSSAPLWRAQVEGAISVSLWNWRTHVDPDPWMFNPQLNRLHLYCFKFWN